jgi:hypothetical protein
MISALSGMRLLNNGRTGSVSCLSSKNVKGIAECRSGTIWMNLVLELGFVHKEKLKTACPLNVDRD